jgi:hypothetical protein
MCHKLLLALIKFFRALLLSSICLNVAAGATFSPASTNANWKDFISVSKEKKWIGLGHPLQVTPTIVNSEIYIPYDISDAWRELDRMLPKNYIDKIAKRFGKECSSNDVGEESYQMHYYFLTFLEESWLEKSNSRLLAFFQQYFHLSNEQVLSNNNEQLIIGMVLCGYYEKERLGVFPDLSALTKKFGTALNN